jgi:hypothetical protein
MMQASKTPYSAVLVGIDESFHLGASLLGMDQSKVDQFKNTRLGALGVLSGKAIGRAEG